MMYRVSSPDPTVFPRVVVAVVLLGAACAASSTQPQVTTLPDASSASATEADNTVTSVAAIEEPTDPPEEPVSVGDVAMIDGMETFCVLERQAIVVLPTRPSETQTTLHLPSGDLLRRVAATRIDDVVFALAVDEIAPVHVMRDYLDGVRAGFLASTGHQLVKEWRFQSSGLPGSELVTRSNDGTTIKRVRAVVTPDRFYLTVITVPARKQNHPLVSQLINSVRIATTPCGSPSH